MMDVQLRIATALIMAIVNAKNILGGIVMLQFKVKMTNEELSVVQLFGEDTNAFYQGLQMFELAINSLH